MVLPFKVQLQGGRADIEMPRQVFQAALMDVRVICNVMLHRQNGLLRFGGLDARQVMGQGDLLVICAQKAVYMRLHLQVQGGPGFLALVYFMEDVLYLAIHPGREQQLACLVAFAQVVQHLLQQGMCGLQLVQEARAYFYTQQFAEAFLRLVNMLPRSNMEKAVP